MESAFRRYKVDEDTRGGWVAIGRQTQWGNKKRVFFLLSGHITSERFRAEANVTIRRPRHELVYRLSSERKMIDLE